MKIAICSSMSHKDLFLQAGEFLASKGHEIFYPNLDEVMDYDYAVMTTEELTNHKHRMIWDHFGKMEACDAILVTNGEKKGIPGYIGANTLMEIAVAGYMKKKIYILNPVAETVPCYVEVLGMKPTVLHGKLENLA